MVALPSSLSECRWKMFCEELPDWYRSQLSSSSVDDDEDDEFDEFDEDEDERGARDESADAAAVAVAADDAMRARAVSCVPSFASRAERALSSDSSRRDSGRSVAASLDFAAVALAVAVADDCGEVAGAEDWGAAAARY